MALLLHLFLLGCFAVAQASNFYNDFFVSWGDGRGNILNNGQMLTLSLDKIMGSGFQSKNEYLFSKIDMNIKLVPGNSAGTVTTFYMSSSGPNHDEIDFEFLGNSSGDPYTLHTNVYSQGKGNKEQQFRLWFDPTANFHVYSILWNPHLILFYVDGTPIRVFKNLESIGLPYLNSQKMNIYATLWDAEDWATQGGRVKTDWSKAPFVATYGSYVIQGANSSNSSRWMNQQLNSRIQQRINSVRAKHLIYDYCYDQKRFPGGEPVECRNTSS